MRHYNSLFQFVADDSIRIPAREFFRSGSAVESGACQTSASTTWFAHWNPTDLSKHHMVGTLESN
jgi:hypothetical protein